MLYQVHGGACDLCVVHYRVRLRATQFFINVTLARLKFKLPDDGRRTKHVGEILI